MTIAIGLRHAEGHLLCADTLVSVPGFYKEGQSKLRTLVTKSCLAYFAIAGDVEFTNRALEVIHLYLDRVEPDILHAKSALDLACFEIHDKWHNYVTDPLQMLGVLAVKGAPPEFVRISGPVVSPAGRLACVGTGEPLAKFLSASVSAVGLNKLEAVRYAAYVLLNVKRHVDGCGGVSEFLNITEQGGCHFPLQDSWVFELLPELESTFNDVDRQIRSVVRDLVLDSVSDGAFELKMVELAEKLTTIRKTYRDKSEARFEAYLRRQIQEHEQSSEDDAT